MKLPLVQIFVVVEKIKVRILKTEVGKGFMRTPFDHELVDPKTKINLENKIIFFSSFFLSGRGGEENPKIIFKCRKGIMLKFINQELDNFNGNVNEIRDVGDLLRKSYLFFITNLKLKKK
jgi:hypothetical protein